MKYLLFAFVLLLCSACSKNNPEDPIIPNPIDTTTHIIELGKGSVLRNGIAWNAEFSADYSYDRNHIRVEGSLRQGSYTHFFDIYDITCIKGLQLMERGNNWNGRNGVPCAGYGVLLSYDQLLNSYHVDSTRSNQYVEILHYDSLTQIVEGRFQTFLEGPTTWSFLPDSIALTEGKFRLKIKG